MAHHESHLTMARGRRCRPAVSLLVFAVFAGGAVAQFRSRVELVRFQVAVTDSEGGFIEDLGVDDFRLYIDGEERPLQVAYAVDVTSENRGAPSASGGERRSAAARRRFLLLLDYAFNTRRGARRAKSTALEVVDDVLRESDVVAVGLIRRQSFQLLIPFTSNREKIVDTIEALDAGLATDLVPPPGPSDFMDYVATVERYIDNLRELATSLQAVEGRKHVLLVSRGFDDRALVGGGLDELSGNAEGRAAGGLGGIAGDPMDPEYLTGSASVRAGMASMVEAYRLADATFHVIDATGLRGAESGQEARVASSMGNRQALSYLASGTDGTATWNVNELGPPLREIDRRTARFYVVAYRRLATDPSEVEVRLEVLRPGARVVSAPDRLSPPPPYPELTETQRALQAADLLLDDSDVLGVDFAARVLPFPALDGAAPRAAVAVQVDEVELRRLASRHGGARVRLEIAVFVLDEDDRVLDLARRGVAAEPAGSGSGSPLLFVDYVNVPLEETRIRILVREAEDGDLAARTLRAAGSPSVLRGRRRLVGPIVVDAWRRAPVPQRTRAEELAHEFEPLRLRNTRYAPIAEASVAPGDSVTALFLVYPATQEVEDWSIEVTEPSGRSRWPLESVAVVDQWSGTGAPATQVLVRGRIPAGVSPGELALNGRVRLDGEHVAVGAPLPIRVRPR